MHICKQIEIIFERYLTGELLPTDQETLDQHLPGCADCRALMSLHEELMQMESHVTDPSPEALHAMRSRVLRQVSQTGAGEGRNYRSEGIARFMPALAAAAMLVIGVFVGNLTAKPSSIDDQLLLSAISRQASVEGRLEDSWDTPLFFSNVSVHDWNDERVNLGFDVCRSIDLNTSLNSPLTSDILTHAILNSESMGGRMRAMEVATLSSEERLTRALVVVLQQDANQALRIEALQALARKQGNEQVQTAMLGALRDDSSVQVRLLALEHLAGQSVSPDEIENIIRQGKEESNSAVFQRARELKINLSSEDWL